MRTSVEVISPVKKKLLVEVDAAEVDSKVEWAYRELGKKAKVPGFRPGKVPRKILERHFGTQVVEDVTKGLVSDTLPTAVEETKAFPLAPPVIENEALKMGQNFRYSAIVEVRPEFELKSYMGLEVEKEICSVTDADVEGQLEEIRKANGKLNSLTQERGVAESDYVVLDYEGFDGESPMEGVKHQNFLLRVGSQDFHPEFEKALIGLGRGDETQITVDFDEKHYHPKLAGRRVRFKVKVTDIKVMELPELNDDFAKGLGGDFEGLEPLKKRLKEEITAREEKRIDRELKKRLVKKISDLVDFELPESLVESEIDYAIQNVSQNLARMGSSIEKAGISQEKLREEFRPAAAMRVKGLLVLGEIAKQNDLTIGETELTEGLREMASSLGQDPEVVRKYYETNRIMEPFRQKLLEEKTLNYLAKGATIKDTEASMLTKDE